MKWVLVAFLGVAATAAVTMAILYAPPKSAIVPPHPGPGVTMGRPCETSDGSVNATCQACLDEFTRLDPSKHPYLYAEQACKCGFRQQPYSVQEQKSLEAYCEQFGIKQ